MQTDRAPHEMGVHRAVGLLAAALLLCQVAGARSPRRLLAAPAIDLSAGPAAASGGGAAMGAFWASVGDAEVAHKMTDFETERGYAMAIDVWREKESAPYVEDEQPGAAAAARGAAVAGAGEPVQQTLPPSRRLLLQARGAAASGRRLASWSPSSPGGGGAAGGQESGPEFASVGHFRLPQEQGGEAEVAGDETPSSGGAEAAELHHPGGETGAAEDAAQDGDAQLAALRGLEEALRREEAGRFGADEDNSAAAGGSEERGDSAAAEGAGASAEPAAADGGGAPGGRDEADEGAIDAPARAADAAVPLQERMRAWTKEAEDAEAREVEERWSPSGAEREGGQVQADREGALGPDVPSGDGAGEGTAASDEGAEASGAGRT